MRRSFTGFAGELPSSCNSVDVIIGNDNAHLMVVRQERVGDNLEEPHAILSPLGWLASRGKVDLSSCGAKALRVQLVKNVEFESFCKLELEARDKEISRLSSKKCCWITRLRQCHGRT